MKPGQKVRYAKPEQGEEEFRFVVLECHDGRVIMRLLDSGYRIEPIETVLVSEIVAA